VVFGDVAGEVTDAVAVLDEVAEVAPQLRYFPYHVHVLFARYRPVL
jgi:hypothetical protein